tara:strand:+ start:160 stop:390 length:231 start_codon:yes stop_codon:yes gene_type:complete
VLIIQNDKKGISFGFIKECPKKYGYKKNKNKDIRAKFLSLKKNRQILKKNNPDIKNKTNITKCLDIRIDPYSFKFK